MIKSKRKVDRFINHLFALYKVPRIPVHIHWNHPALVTDEGEYGFGVFSFRDPEHPCIHVAAKVIGKSSVAEVFAHEFVHYLQYMHGRDMDNPNIEPDAEFWAEQIMHGWNCYRELGLPDFPQYIWEPMPRFDDVEDWPAMKGDQHA